MKQTCTFLFLAMQIALGAQTIAEKKASLTHHSSTDLTADMQDYLRQINQEHEALTKKMQQLYSQAYTMYEANAPEQNYRDILTEIQAAKKEIAALEERWRELAAEGHEDEYALWHQPNTTLEQLVIDFGSQDYVYIIPPFIANIPISVTSNLPIPRSSWGEMLETILTQNGVGIRQINSYSRQLFLLKEDHSNLKLITNNRKELALLPSNERIAFVLSPEPADVRRAWFFLEKFINPNSVVLQQIGRDILIIAQVSEVEELLKLYDFVSNNKGNKEYKAVTLRRIDAEEMAKILSAIFGGLSDTLSGDSGERTRIPANAKGIAKGAPTPFPNRGGDDDNGLKIIPLSNVAQAVFLVGTREEIRKAENIIFDVEEQVGETRGKIVYWYTTKHSDPEELADILSRVYYLMAQSCLGNDSDSCDAPGNKNTQVINIDEPPPVPLLPPPYASGYWLAPPIGELPIEARPPVNEDRDNFIVDLKTGAIVMVVEADLLPRIKELIRKLDVPKRMVQIEVLLFEKQLNREDDFGLNLLRIGTSASNTTRTAVNFNDPGSDPLHPLTTGIFDFILSRKENGAFPAFDLLYRFLLMQEDVYINASPSVLAVNQTPAIIEIAEEISVNTGIFEIPTNGSVTLKDAFARATYGIKIEITPTIHVMEEDDDEFCDPNSCDYVDMITDITFQTFKSNFNDRPDVTTRHIVNEVSIPDGQTVILGGLRERNSLDTSEKIPYLGELPGIGKLFSISSLTDDTTEMFIFITPKIVYDPCEDLERIRSIEMTRRPGDIPAFMCRLVAAEERESQRLFAGSLAIAFGRKPDRCVPSPYEENVLCEEPLEFPTGEYDGR